MKRFLSMFLSLAFICSMFSFLDVDVKAYNEIGAIRFHINEQTDYDSYSVTVDCYKITSGEVRIPADYNTVPVTRIEGCFSTTEAQEFSVYIPETINCIENEAFGECESVTAFYVSEKNEYYKSVDGVLYTKDGKNLIRYPQIKEGDSFTVPDGVEVIESRAFSGCANLNNIYLSDSVKSIGNSAFYGTAYYNNSDNWSNGVLYNNGHLLDVKSSVGGHFTVKDGIKNIATGAFSSNDKITSVSLPSSVETIEELALCGCDGLVEIDFGNGLKSIGSCAFDSCDLLAEVRFPETLEFIDINAFYQCNALKTVNFSQAPVVIEQQAFWCCNGLTEIEIPESVIKVGDAAFADCENLATVTIADGVDEIGSRVFDNTEFYNNDGNWENGALYIDNHLIAVKEDYAGDFYVKEGTKTIASYAFGWCEAVESIIIPESVIEISDFAFWCCENLKSVNLPSALTVLKRSVFGHCMKLQHIIIPESVTIIEDEAFWNCNSLNDVVLPEKLEYIGDSAFISCENFETVNIPENVKYIGQEAFSGGEYLKNINVDENNQYYKSVDGVLFDKNVKTLIQYPGRCTGQYKWTETSYEIPDTVTKIGEYAFGYCYELDRVIIPDSVIEIGAFAFVCCRSFKELVIPDSVVKIGWRAFDNCINLENVSLSENITYLSYGMLENCDSLLSIKIPSNVKAILPSVFYYCDSLTEIIIPDGITQIDYRLCYQCPSLESITIPKTIESICQFAFYKCDKLRFVFYGGTQEDWNSIDLMTSGNQWLLDAKFHYGTKGHTLSNWITDKKATVNKAGSKHKECTECGEVLETATIKQLKCDKPSLKKLENTADGVKITWSKESGADKYYVYRKTGSSGKYSKIATVKGNSKITYTDKSAKSGKKYYYYVKAVNEAGSSSASGSKSIYYLADTTLSTPKSTKSGVTLKWKKVTGAEGYQVYRKTGSGSYSKIATVKGNSKVTYTDKKAKKGKTYTYKIKAYKSKTYSAYSNAKKIKDKY